MELRELLGGLEGALNPELGIYGRHGIPSKLLSMCTRGNKNIVDEYMTEHYMKKIQACFPNIQLENAVDLYIPFVNSYNEETQQRELTVDVALYITLLLRNSLDINLLKTDITDDEADEVIKETIKYYKRKLKEIKDGEISINEFPVLANRYKGAKELREKLITKKKENKRHIFEKIEMIAPLTLKEFCEKSSDFLTMILAGNRYMKNEKFEPLNLKEIENYMDFDRFYFLLAVRYIQLSKLTYEEEVQLDGTIVFIERYVRAVEKIRKQRKYNPTYKLEGEIFSDRDGELLSLDQLIEEYKELLAKAQDKDFDYYVKLLDLYEEGKIESGLNLRDPEVIKQKLDEIEEKEEIKELLAGWEFIPKGSIPKQPTTNNTPQYEEDLEEFHLTREPREYTAPTIASVLEDTAYLYTIVGKEKFAGYKGFIYKNGYVVFEKGIEIDGILHYEFGNATYVMRLDNFRRMSKLSKPDIMDHIKKGNTDVERIYHTKTWESKIKGIEKRNPYFNNQKYSNGVKGEIERLISIGELIEEPTQELKKTTN